MNRVRKNYGGRMIFGDEKLTPLRSVPRCALPWVGSFNTRVCGSGLGSPLTQIAPYGRNIAYPPTVRRNRP